MTRGTTPTCRFTLPFLASDLSEWVIGFAQRGVEKFSIGPEDSSAEGCEITVRLSQENTLSLEAGVDVQIQLRGLRGADGEVIASRILTAAVEPCVSDEVLG